MTRFTKILSIITVIFCINFQNAYSEVIYDSDFDILLDVPEGFKIADYSEDGFSYTLEHPNIPVTLAFSLQNNQKNNSNTENPKQTLNTALNKLSANYDIDSFDWYTNICAISTFSFNLDKSYKGWAVSTPTKISNFNLVLLCYAPAKDFEKCEQFIISTLNSLTISTEQMNIPGIITSYAFPQTTKQEITLNIANKKIKSELFTADLEASQFVVDLEYAVLTLYSNHKKIKEAWERYYRMIYKDSYSRILPTSKKILNTFQNEASQNNKKLTTIEYAQILLSWVQNFEYRRANSKVESDFTSIPATICGQGSDCDSRSMLLCILLKSIGIETIMYFSPEYSHAITATQIDAPGYKFKLKVSENQNIELLVGETTAKVTWGMIASDMTDESKWLPVIFPF